MPLLVAVRRSDSKWRVRHRHAFPEARIDERIDLRGQVRTELGQPAPALFLPRHAVHLGGHRVHVDDAMLEVVDGEPDRRGVEERLRLEQTLLELADQTLVEWIRRRLGDVCHRNQATRR